MTWVQGAGGGQPTGGLLHRQASALQVLPAHSGHTLMSLLSLSSVSRLYYVLLFAYFLYLFFPLFICSSVFYVSLLFSIISLAHYHSLIHFVTLSSWIVSSSYSSILSSNPAPCPLITGHLTDLFSPWYGCHFWSSPLNTLSFQISILSFLSLAFLCLLSIFYSLFSLHHPPFNYFLYLLSFFLLCPLIVFPLCTSGGLSFHCPVFLCPLLLCTLPLLSCLFLSSTSSVVYFFCPLLLLPYPCSVLSFLCPILLLSSHSSVIPYFHRFLSLGYFTSSVQSFQCPHFLLSSLSSVLSLFLPLLYPSLPHQYFNVLFMFRWRRVTPSWPSTELS